VSARHRDQTGSPAVVPQPAAGPASLENHLGGADGKKYRQYQYELIEPHIGRSILEIGSGLGDFTRQFADRIDYLAVSDSDPYCIDQLTLAYSGRTDVDVLEIELPGHIDVRRKVDTVLLMNVLEHIQDDVLALRTLAGCADAGGRLVIWVPAYEQLYGDFDRLVGHCRRYTPATLRRAVEAAGLRPVLCRPVNFLGGLAWWLAVRRLKVGHASTRLVATYDSVVVPVTRMLERFLRLPFGQSVLCVAEVPAPITPHPDHARLNES
jgi:SAM-dependent methyltransferase